MTTLYVTWIVCFLYKLYKLPTLRCVTHCIFALSGCCWRLHTSCRNATHAIFLTILSKLLYRYTRIIIILVSHIILVSRLLCSMFLSRSYPSYCIAAHAASLSLVSLLLCTMFLFKLLYRYTRSIIITIIIAGSSSHDLIQAIVSLHTQHHYNYYHCCHVLCSCPSCCIATHASSLQLVSWLLCRMFLTMLVQAVVSLHTHHHYN
eukprot:g8462.t1